MAVAIGAAVIAPPAAPAAAGAGVGAVLSTVNKFIEMAGTAKDSQKMSDTFKAVCEAIQKTQSFVESTFKMVSAMEAIRAQQDSASDASGPSKETLSSFYSANMESQTLVTLASWDAWNEESDAAMASIENSNIAGASEYRVQLKKHAIHAKLVAQLQAQYAKAGQEHVQQLATAGVAAADVRRLEQLDSSFAGEIDAARDAAEICYDSVMTVRLNITVEMRNATWAYRFLSLRKSKVIMDPTKSIVFLKADALAIAREVEQWQEDFSSDAATYMPTPVRLSRLLGPSFKDQIASLITSGVASFTLMPVALGAPDSSSNPGPFTRGSNFRVEGMRAFLVGAKVKNDQDEVRLEIATAGLYADRDTQGVAHYFQSMPMSRTFCYRSVDSSAAVFPDSSIAIDSFIAGKSHVDFTPFTNWKIKVMEPGNLDLDGLEDVVIVWRGTAQFQ